MAEVKKPKAVQWFEENVVNDVEDIMKIGKLANKFLEERLNLDIPSIESIIAMYAKVYDAARTVVLKRVDGTETEAAWSEFYVNIASRVIIGFTNSIDEDAEKPGNIMMFMQHVEHQRKDDEIDEEKKYDETIELVTEWNAKNVQVQADVVKEISEQGMTNIKEIINIAIATSEFVIPLFCIIHTTITEYAKAMAHEKNEFDICGLYKIQTHVNDDTGEIEIFFEPSIDSKLFFKSDEKAAKGLN